MMTEFFPDVPKIQYRRPEVAQPAGVQALQCRRGRRRQDDEGAPAVLGRLLAHVLQPAVRPVRRGNRHPALGRRHATRSRTPSARRRSRSSSSRSSGVPFYAFHDRDVAPEGEEPQGKPRQSRRGRQGSQGRTGADRRQAALGDGQPVLQSPLHARRGHQPELRRLRLRRPPRSRRPWRSPTSWEGRATRSGGAAKATRPC